QEQIELVLDRERPRMRESGAAAQIDVLRGDKEFPEGRYLRKFAPRRQRKVNCEHDEISRQNAQGAPGKEAAELDGLAARQGGDELSADEVTAQDEEKIDPDPAEPVPAVRQGEPEDAGVVNDHDDD